MRPFLQIPPFSTLLLLSVAGLGLAVSQAGTAVPAQSTADPVKQSGDVTYSSGTAQYLADPHTLQFSHGVQFGQDDATLRTDAALTQFDKNNNVVSAQAQGPVHLFDPQDDLTGQHGSVDFIKHIATLRDNIVLVVKPGKREASARGSSARKQFKDPATLTCQMMTYDYRHKIGRIPGPLTVTQVVQTKEDGPQTRTLTAEAGLYNGRAETIQLLGTITGSYSDGSVIEGDTRSNGKPVLISIKEGSEGILVPFQTHGHFTTKPQTDSGKDDGSDDADLSLPAVPPHPSAPAAAPVPVPSSASSSSASPSASALSASSSPPPSLPAPASSPSPAGTH